MSRNIYSYKLLPIVLLQCVIGIQLLVASYLPMWLIVFSCLVCLYRIVSFRRLQKPDSHYIKYSLFIASNVAFFAYFSFRLTIEMAGSFLFLMTVLKSIEINNKKDAVIAVYTVLFLISVSFLFEQGILHTLIQLLSMGLCFYTLMRLNLGTDFRFIKENRHYLKSSVLRSGFISVPIIIICFVFFPRLPPLWSMPFEAGAAKIGFGDTVSPGDISKLTRSSEVAFRVKFDSDYLPQMNERYWRSLVLDQFDGRGWSNASSTKWSRTFADNNSVLDTQRQNNSEVAKYEVMLEPHFEKWAFALDGSVSQTDGVQLKDMGQLRFSRPVLQPSVYKMNLYRDTNQATNKLHRFFKPQLTNTNRLLKEDYSQDLVLPDKEINPRTKALVNSLLQSFSKDQDILLAVLDMFRNESFYYSLEPPLLGGDSIDEFLFGARTGFCEHYASALAYMMRLAGIPARVIVGYLGGEKGAGGEYLIVRQYDAHAWVEVKLDQFGWVRVDPTAMVAPSRILSGSEAAFSESEMFLANSPVASFVSNYGILKALNLYLDEIKYGWQNWVLAYDKKDQKGIFESLFGEYSVVGLFQVLAYFILALLLIALIYLWSRNKGANKSIYELKYLIWLSVISKLGIVRNKGETPRQFLLKIETTAPRFVVRYTQKVTRQLEDNVF